MLAKVELMLMVMVWELIIHAEENIPYQKESLTILHAACNDQRTIDDLLKNLNSFPDQPFGFSKRQKRQKLVSTLVNEHEHSAMSLGVHDIVVYGNEVWLIPKNPPYCTKKNPVLYQKHPPIFDQKNCPIWYQKLPFVPKKKPTDLARIDPGGNQYAPTKTPFLLKNHVASPCILHLRTLVHKMTTYLPPFVLKNPGMGFLGEI